MARPLKEGMDYFPHDTDAVNDEKIEALRSLYGNDGYAFYFILLERIYRTCTGEIDLRSDIRKATIISKLGISKELFERILKDAFEVELFDKEYFESTGKLTSPGIKRRIGEVEKLRSKWRTKKVFQGENPVDNSEENLLENGQKTRERKEKKSKVNINTVQVQSFFESVWKLYPNKKGKGQISDTQKSKLFEIGVEELKRCIERYTKTKPDWQQYQNGSTFFNSGYVDYLDKNFIDTDSKADYCDLSNYTPEE